MSYGTLSPQQHAYLLNPLRKTRIAKRSQGGKQLSYLESWEVKAHLTRIFGFCNWDSQLLEYRHVTDRAYLNGEKEMVEVIYSAHMELTVRDREGLVLCRHSEGAVGSASGPASMLGDHHDNALKTAASDALKRCAINLGTQFGLSLYDNGSTMDVVRNVLVAPPGVDITPVAPQEKPETAPTDEEAERVLRESLGATEAPQNGSEPGSPENITQEGATEAVGEVKA